MDELNLMRDFRADRAVAEPAARDAIRKALEARMSVAAELAAPAAPRRGFLSRRRRLLAFAGATGAAAVVAGVLVLGSGPTAQPAAAELLRQTATVAGSSEAPTISPVPGPGQFLYRKFKRLELEGWIPGGTGDMGGRLKNPNAFNGLMPTTQEWWTGPDGEGRVREVAGTPQFLTAAEQQRWEAAGSRLPAPFDPEYQQRYKTAYADATELREGVVDTEHGPMKGFRFPDTSQLPTTPEALRLAVESNQIKVGGFNLIDPEASHFDSEETIAELFNILQEGNPMTPQLRAAIFNALAEVPGIEVDTEATDILGRQGYAVRSVDPKSGGGVEFIFDPDTAELLAQREFISDPSRRPTWEGLPAGMTLRETAYLEQSIVDSTK